MAKNAVHAVGKRKTAVARIWLKKGTGKITINKRTMDEYYKRDTAKMIVMQPFELTGNLGKFDLTVNVIGGGVSGQAGAIRHALSRAFAAMDPEFRKTLKAKGLMTRDSRKKERKLPGQPGARKRYQFSKR
jgi:small subunit ribosomal protein S9